MVFIIAVSMCIIGCIDNDYDIDDLDKNAVAKVPPILLGNIDTIWVNLLPEGLPPVTGSVEGMEITKIEYINGVFSEDIIDKFFNEKATWDVTLQAKVDVLVESAQGLVMEIYPEIEDSDGTVNTNVKIEKVSVTNGNNQQISIVFKKDDFKYMEDARDLKFTIVMKANTISLEDEDFVYMKNVVLKSSGLHFEF